MIFLKILSVFFFFFFFFVEPVNVFNESSSLISVLTLDAGLKHTGVCLELLHDTPEQEDMYLFFEDAIRGGISTVTHRHAVANNKYLPQTYDPTKPSIFVMYLDSNNLVSLN